jgi:hypothetical protein
VLVAAQLLAVQLVQVVVVHHNAAVPVVHSVRMQARVLSESQRAERRYAMNSTICKRQNSVAQLFHTVMDLLQYVCDAEHHWQISLTRSMPIQQR